MGKGAGEGGREGGKGNPGTRDYVVSCMHGERLATRVRDGLFPVLPAVVVSENFGNKLTLSPEREPERKRERERGKGRKGKRTVPLTSSQPIGGTDRTTG